MGEGAEDIHRRRQRRQRSSKKRRGLQALAADLLFAMQTWLQRRAVRS
jgi:hypothetical protein